MKTNLKTSLSKRKKSTEVLKRTSVPKRKHFEDKKVGKEDKTAFEKALCTQEKTFLKNDFCTLKIKEFKMKKTQLLKKTSVPKRKHFWKTLMYIKEKKLEIK